MKANIQGKMAEDEDVLKEPRQRAKNKKDQPG